MREEHWGETQNCGRIRQVVCDRQKPVLLKGKIVKKKKKSYTLQHIYSLSQCYFISLNYSLFVAWILHFLQACD